MLLGESAALAFEFWLITMCLWGVLQAYMFKYDSVHGHAKKHDAKADTENSLLIGGKSIAVYGHKYVCQSLVLLNFCKQILSSWINIIFK